jgi:AbrB family looped-hinge helix DNA binding protein
MNESTLTERGQISLPADLRKDLHLRAGQKLRFEAVSDHEFRVFAPQKKAPGPLSVLGYGRKMGSTPRRTKDWMKELREGES